jgi:PST family polysaccharide transporter
MLPFLKYSRIYRGAAYLSVVQYLTYVLPIVLFPIIIKALGKSTFGEIIFAQVSVALIGILVNYGFDISGVRDTAVIKMSPRKISLMYSEILYVRFSLFIVLFLPFIVILELNNAFVEDKVLFLLFYLTLIEFIVIPRWLFQGLEEMKVLAIISFITKVFGFVLIVIMLTFWKNAWVVPLGYLFGILIGVTPVIVYLKKAGVELVSPSLRSIVNRYKLGWNVFIATISVGLYMNVTTFIVGIYLPAEAVGMYGIVEKIVRATQNFTKPIADVLYPIFSEKSASLNNYLSSLKILKKILLFYSLILIASITVLSLFANWIFGYLYGEFSDSMNSIFRVMIFAIFFGPLNFVLGNIGLMNLGETKYYANSVVFVSIICVLVSMYLISFLGLTGASYGFLLPELLLFILLVLKVYSITEMRLSSDETK